MVGRHPGRAPGAAADRRRGGHGDDGVVVVCGPDRAGAVTGRGTTDAAADSRGRHGPVLPGLRGRAGAQGARARRRAGGRVCVEADPAERAGHADPRVASGAGRRTVRRSCCWSAVVPIANGWKELRGSPRRRVLGGLHRAGPVDGHPAVRRCRGRVRDAVPDPAVRARTGGARDRHARGLRHREAGRDRGLRWSRRHRQARRNGLPGRPVQPAAVGGPAHRSPHRSGGGEGDGRGGPGLGPGRVGPGRAAAPYCGSSSDV